MSENPDFLPEGNEKWLSDLLSGFGNEENTGNSSENDSYEDALLDSMTPEDRDKTQFAGLYLFTFYTDYQMKAPESMEAAAIKMMRTLASFLENGFVESGNDRFRVGDRYPDITVRHAQIAARYGIWQASNNIANSIKGTDTHNSNKIMFTYFSILSEISKTAVEMEDKRRQRDQGNI